MLYIYYLIKLLIVICYLATIRYGWIYFFKPIIALHGAGEVAATWFTISLLGVIFGFLFMFIPKPKTPQATYKEQSNETSNP